MYIIFQNTVCGKFVVVFISRSEMGSSHKFVNHYLYSLLDRIIYQHIL